MRLITTAALAVASLFASTGTAGAAERYFSHLKGSLIAGTDLSQPLSSCVDRDAFIFPSLQPDGTSRAAVEVADYDHCADQFLLLHHGDITGGFTIDRDLNSAALHATVPVVDGLAGDTPAGTLTVDLAWTGTGPVYDVNNRYANGHDREHGFTIVEHDRARCRAATVAGSISDGTVDYASGATATATLCEQLAGTLFLFIQP